MHRLFYENRNTDLEIQNDGIRKTTDLVSRLHIPEVIKIQWQETSERQNKIGGPGRERAGELAHIVKLSFGEKDLGCLE